MTTPQILHFPGAPSLPGYPALDVTESEIEVANIPSLAAWVGLDDWDIPASNDKFLDRVAGTDIATTAPVNVQSNFAASPNGKAIYTVPSVSSAIKLPSFNTAGSFTVGFVCKQGVSIGSSSSAASTSAVPAPWYIVNGPSGSGVEALQVDMGQLNTGAYSAYTGARLSATALNVVVLIVDRFVKKITVRVNGQPGLSITHAIVGTASLFNELTFGAIRAAGAGQLVRANSAFAAAVAFTSALAGDELASLEAMLAEVAA